MNTKVIEGLRAMSEGFNLLIEGLSESVAPISTAVSEGVVEKPKKSKKSEPVKEVETETEATSEYTEEELNSMSYNELKKLAKELGISATGNRKELVKKLLSGDTDETDEAEDEPVKEEAPKKSTKTKTSKKKPEPVEDDEDEEDEEDESEDEDEDETDPIAEQVNELVADMTDEEIRELLESVDISSKGKREALISKVITAVSEGLISLEDEEDEDTDSEDEDDADEEEEAPKKSAKSKKSEKSGDITETMTKKRKKAYKELCDETNEQFESEEITREDLIDFINEYNGTNDKMKKVSDEDLLAQYLEISAMLIDDDGEIVEEGAYYINDEPYCCGHPLTYNKKKKQYVCEHCGAEYDEE